MAVAGTVNGVAGTETRRGVLAASGWMLMALMGLQAAVAFVVYFWPRKTGAFGSVVSAGKVADYKVGDIKYFVEGKFYLVRLEEGFIALYQKCPHLGCVVPWQKDYVYQDKTGWFRCPCHGSTYSMQGQIVFGPAPRPLDYMKIQIKGGSVQVNTGLIMKRDEWVATQAVPA